MRTPRTLRHALVVLLATVAATATSVAFEPDARAAEPEPPAADSPSEPPPELQSKPTWAFEMGGVVAYTAPPIAGGTTPFGLGFGGRAGFSISHVYVGLNIVDYLGAKDVNVTDTSLLYGAELGYDVHFADFGSSFFALRPRVGAGGVSIFRTDPDTAAATTSSSGGRGGRGRVDVVSSASGSSSSNVTTVDAFYVQPGATLMFVAGTFFVAADGNVLIVPGLSYSGAAATTWRAFGVQGQTGLRF